jgi:hypothetical protein
VMEENGAHGVALYIFYMCKVRMNTHENSMEGANQRILE